MPEQRPFLVGVTGNIACGKSLVGEILEELGAEVIDADRVAHEVMAPGGAVLEQIAERFGERVLNEDGTLNRQALGQIVFSDPEALRDLDRITHPPTVAEVLRRARHSTAPVVVIDAIKLFETELADHCDETWTVYCAPEIQRQRLQARNGLDEDDARQRIEAQPPQEEKRARADRVIDNSGTIDDTRRQVQKVWETLVRSPAG